MITKEVVQRPRKILSVHSQSKVCAECGLHFLPSVTSAYCPQCGARRRARTQYVPIPACRELPCECGATVYLVNNKESVRCTCGREYSRTGELLQMTAAY